MTNRRAKTKATWSCALCYCAPPDVARIGRSDVCVDCRASLTARGLAWCCLCKRRVQRDAIAAGRRWCRPCEEARKRKYKTEQALERKRRANQEWYKRNREEIIARRNEPARVVRRKARFRVWYARNGERIRAAARAHYQANRAKVRAYVQAWRERNREQDRARRREQYRRRKLAVLQSWKRAA